MTPIIKVTRRFCDWHTCVEGEPEIWGCGPTVDAAIGDLIRSHSHRFGIALDYSEIPPL